MSPGHLCKAEPQKLPLAQQTLTLPMPVPGPEHGAPHPARTEPAQPPHTLTQNTESSSCVVSLTELQAADPLPQPQTPGLPSGVPRGALTWKGNSHPPRRQPPSSSRCPTFCQ